MWLIFLTRRIPLEKKTKIDFLCEKLTDELIENGSINKEERDVYIYCFNTIFETGMNIAFTLIIGCLLGKITETILLLFVIMTIRSFSGGYHAKTTWSCFIWSELSYFSILGLNHLVNGEYNIISGLVVGILLMLSIFLCGPAPCRTVKISREEYFKNKKKLGISLTINLLFFVVFYLFQKKILMSLVIFCLMYILILEFLGMFETKN